MSITANDIRAAATTLQGQVIRTPMLATPLLSRQFECDLYLKLECQQYTSSFKTRGAFVAMQNLSRIQRKSGVIAMSAGNHAQAVAYHAERMGMPAVIVMPAQTPFAKVARTQSYGAEVVLEGRNLNECEGTVNKLIEERGLTLIHPYDDELVMAGQGTVGLEMIEDEPDLDILVVPIGGGGLIGGIATIAREIRPNIQIIGVGGIDSGQAAFEKIGAGANAVQLYTGMVYKGPGVVREMKKELISILKKENLKNINEAVGINA